MSFQVQKKRCSTCIYNPKSPLDLEKLENDVKDSYGFFKGHRICHHTDENGDSACCRGFWDKNKDNFQAGQLAQRFNCVKFVDIDVLK